AQPHPQRAVARLPCALPRGGGAAGARDIRVSARSLARMERGPRSADLCRLQRTRVSAKLQGLASAARLAAAAGFAGRAVRLSAPLDRLGRERPAAISNARRQTRD